MDSKKLLTQPLDEIIVEMGTSTLPMSFVEQRKAAAFKRLFELLADSINKNTEAMDKDAASADRLSRVLIALNFLIAIATVAGVIIALLTLFR